MTPRQRALSLLTALVALAAHMPSASAGPVVTIVSMNGPAEIEKDGATVVGVSTGSDATVIVQLDATHEVTVYQNTHLRIGDRLDLRVGTVRARGSLMIVTANAQSTLRESEMTVAYDQSGITTIEVTDNEAVVLGINDGADQRVPAGLMVRVGSDGIATTPQPISPEQIIAARVAPAGERDSARERVFPYFVTIAAAVCLLFGLIGSRRTRKVVSQGRAIARGESGCR